VLTGHHQLCVRESVPIQSEILKIRHS
jgi:hypothetical protein